MGIEIQHGPNPSIVGLAAYAAGRNKWENQQNNMGMALYRDAMRARQDEAMQRERLMMGYKMAGEERTSRQAIAEAGLQAAHRRSVYQDVSRTAENLMKEQGLNQRAALQRATQIENSRRAHPEDPFQPPAFPDGAPPAAGPRPADNGLVRPAVPSVADGYLGEYSRLKAAIAGMYGGGQQAGTAMSGYRAAPRKPTMELGPTIKRNPRDLVRGSYLGESTGQWQSGLFETPEAAAKARREGEDTEDLYGDFLGVSE
jgi:hypothetical protein